MKEAQAIFQYGSASESRLSLCEIQRGAHVLGIENMRFEALPPPPIARVAFV